MTVATLNSQSEETAFALRGALLAGLRSEGQSPAPIIQEIEALRWNHNVDGYLFRPEWHASLTAKIYIRAIYPFVDPNLPQPEADSDGSGGIEIQWRRGRRTVILSCRAKLNQRDFIYIQDGRHNTVDASPLNLKECLNWLMS